MRSPASRHHCTPPPAHTHPQSHTFPHFKHYRYPGIHMVTFEDALRVADFFSLHMPLTPVTKDLFNGGSDVRGGVGHDCRLCVDLLDTAAIKGRGCHIRAGGCLFRCGHRHLRGQERPCMATPFDLLLHTTSPLLPPSLQTMPSPRSIIRPSCIQQRPCHCPFLRLPPHPLPFSPLPCR